MPKLRTKFWQTQRFKELQKEWEQRLIESGFKDAESKGKLKQNAANSYRTSIREIIESKQRYYELLGHWYHEEGFLDAVENFIMRRRAEGISIKQIGSELREIGERNSRETIRKVIRYYEYKWEVKKKKTHL